MNIMPFLLQQQLTALDIAQGGGHTAVCEELHKYLNLQTKTDRESSCEDPESQQEPRRPDRDSNRSEVCDNRLATHARESFPQLYVYMSHIHGEGLD